MWLKLAPTSTDTYDDSSLNGMYVLSPCDEQEEELTNAPCGQLEQGKKSIISGGLLLDLDENGVPRLVNGGAEVNDCSEIPTGGANDGAVIHCGGLPPSPFEFGTDLPKNLFFSCLVAGNDNIIRNLTICNGEAVVQRNPPLHRNGIVIRPGTEAVVEEVRVVNTRRGVLGFTESHRATGVTVRNSLVDGTSLLGYSYG